MQKPQRKALCGYGYIGKKLAEIEIDLVTIVRKNMKAKAMSEFDRAMLSKRYIIETINDQLKNISQGLTQSTSK